MEQQLGLWLGAMMARVVDSLPPTPCTDNTFSFGVTSVDFCCTWPSILTSAYNLSFGPQSTCMGWGCVPHFPDEGTEA